MSRFEEALARAERERANASARETLLASGYEVRRGGNGNVVIAEKGSQRLYGANEVELTQLVASVQERQQRHPKNYIKHELEVA